MQLYNRACLGHLAIFRSICLCPVLVPLRLIAHQSLIRCYYYCLAITVTHTYRIRTHWIQIIMRTPRSLVQSIMIIIQYIITFTTKVSSQCRSCTGNASTRGALLSSVSIGDGRAHIGNSPLSTGRQCDRGAGYQPYLPIPNGGCHSHVNITMGWNFISLTVKHSLTLYI